MVVFFLTLRLLFGHPSRSIFYSLFLSLLETSLDKKPVSSTSSPDSFLGFRWIVSRLSLRIGRLGFVLLLTLLNTLTRSLLPRTLLRLPFLFLLILLVCARNQFWLYNRLIFGFLVNGRTCLIARIRVVFFRFPFSIFTFLVHPRSHFRLNLQMKSFG